MQKPIKSFVLRAGRVSKRQQMALDLWLEDYLLPLPNEPWCFKTIFGRESETVVEIGFGMGASLLEMAILYPKINFIGIEVHRAGIGSLVADLRDNGINNVRVATFDAVELFNCALANDSLSGVQIFFPDPWPKKRHHKRRLIQPEFVQQIVTKLKPNGFIHCATDWESYAEQMLTVLSANPYLRDQKTINKSLAQSSDFNAVLWPGERPVTKFERRGQRLGHNIWDLIFIKYAISQDANLA